MTPEDFIAWLNIMSQRGYSQADCAELIGRQRQWVSIAKRQGCDRTSALACMAVYQGFEPFTVAHVASSDRRSAHQGLF